MIPQPLLRPTLAFLFVIAASGCSWQSPVVGPPHEAEFASAADTGQRAAQFALWQQGAPYVWGGATPNGFDCSGLVFYAYRLAGKDVPRTTALLHRNAKPIGRSALKPGDLVFFDIDGKVAHVGIYIDRDRFVHAPRAGRDVSVESLNNDFYRDAFRGGGRLP
jgi:cell wall-associated NlpC family hydrolase